MKHYKDQSVRELLSESGNFKLYKVTIKSLKTGYNSIGYRIDDSTGEKVISIFKRTIPVSILLSLPGFIFGNLLSNE